MNPLLIEHLPPSRRSLRLAVVTETYPPEVNGVALTLSRFVEGLLARNHEIQLIRPRQAPAERVADGEGFGGLGELRESGGFDEVLMGGVPVPRYPNLRIGLPAKWALLRQWTLRRPDLVHIVTEGPLGWSALHAALKLKIPVCSDFRTNFHAYSLYYGIGWLKKPIVSYLRKFHNRTLLTMVPSEHLRSELAASGFRNLRVVARGVDTRLFDPGRRSETLRRQWGATPDQLVVLHVGRLAPEKNLAALADAFIAVRRRQPDARLVVVGDGPEANALRARLPDAIFAGTRHGEDLAAHYASGDLFLFPSLTETFGNVTVEAMASGLPVVAFNYAAAAQYVQHETSGLLADYGRTADFAAMAGQLAARHSYEAERFRAMGRKARQTACNFSSQSLLV